jgi:hypothetical protein
VNEEEEEEKEEGKDRRIGERRVKGDRRGR